MGRSAPPRTPTDPAAADPVIARLACGLIEQGATVRFETGSRLLAIYGSDDAVEGYHCNYGLNPACAGRLARRPLRGAGRDLPATCGRWGSTATRSSSRRSISPSAQDSKGGAIRSSRLSSTPLAVITAGIFFFFFFFFFLKKKKKKKKKKTTEPMLFRLIRDARRPDVDRREVVRSAAGVDVGDAVALVGEGGLVGPEEGLPAVLLAGCGVRGHQEGLEVDVGHAAVHQLDAQAVHLAGEAGGGGAARLDAEEQDRLAGIRNAAQ